MYSNNRRAFFKYVGSKLNGRSQEIQLTVNDEAVRDRVIADAFKLEFCRNFSSVTDVSACLTRIMFIKLRAFNQTALILWSLKQ